MVMAGSLSATSTVVTVFFVAIGVATPALVSISGGHRQFLPGVYEVDEELGRLCSHGFSLLLRRSSGIIDAVLPCLGDVVGVRADAGVEYLADYLVVGAVGIEELEEVVWDEGRILPALEAPHLDQLREVLEGVAGLPGAAVYLEIPLHPVLDRLGELGVGWPVRGGDHDAVLSLRDLGGEVHYVFVTTVVVDEDETLHTVVGEALNGVEEDIEESLVAVSDGSRELHVVWRVARPSGVEADAVGLLCDVVYELGDAYTVTPQWEVDGVLLDRADADDDDWRGVVGEPVLECWARQLPEPEPR